MSEALWGVAPTCLSRPAHTAPITLDFQVSTPEFVCIPLPSSLPRAFLLPFFSRRSAPTAQTTSAPLWAKTTGMDPSSAVPDQ